MCTEKKGFHQRSKGGDLGEIKVFGFMRCSRDLLAFYYAPRGRDSFYFDFNSILWVVLKEVVV